MRASPEVSMWPLLIHKLIKFKVSSKIKTQLFSLSSHISELNSLVAVMLAQIQNILIIIECSMGQVLDLRYVLAFQGSNLQQTWVCYLLSPHHPLLRSGTVARLCTQTIELCAPWPLHPLPSGLLLFSATSPVPGKPAAEKNFPSTLT